MKILNIYSLLVLRQDLCSAPLNQIRDFLRSFQFATMLLCSVTKKKRLWFVINSIFLQRLFYYKKTQILYIACQNMSCFGIKMYTSATTFLQVLGIDVFYYPEEANNS